QAEDGIRDPLVTGVQTCALPIFPLAGAYWAVMRLRAARARGDAVRLPLPTIAVGNLSVGGTGKTPLAAWIASYCAAHGRTPGIRSEERRVGKECREGGEPEDSTK